MAVIRSRPGARIGDSALVPQSPNRADEYLGAFTTPLGSAKTLGYAAEGSYFTTYNVTDGTGIAGHPAPVQADLSTKPLLHVFNGNTVASGICLYPDFLRIRMTAIGAGASTTDFTVWVDNAGATSKSGGTGTVATPVNCRSDQPFNTGAVVTFGVVTATAPASEKRVDHQRIRSVVPVVEDQYTFSFGHTGYNYPAATPLSGTLITNAFVHCPPVCVPPLGNFKVVEWGVTQSGAHSFEYTFAWIER